MANNNTLNFIARFDGTTWQPLAGGMDGPVRSVRAYPDGLYAAGWFTYADTVQANGLARWDGTQWHRVHNLPLLDSLTGINFINDVALMGDDVYIGGNFDSPPNTAIYSIAKYNGSAWVPLGNGFRGTYAQVLRLEANDSLLYVAGAFADQGPYGNPLNPASGIVAYNGEDWVQLGNGTDGSTVPWVIDMAWHNDTLYVCGDFNRIGDVPANRLAYWDGQRWCTLLPGPLEYIGGGTTALSFFRDSLYLGGGFGYIGTDTMYRVAKWIGGDHVEECGVPLGVEQVHATLQALLIYPNPAHDLITFAWPASAVAALIFDTQSRPVVQMSQRTTNVDVSTLAAGSYTLRLLDNHGTTISRARFIKW